MRGSDIFLAFFIFLIFLGLYFYNVFTINFKNIENNWPEYRCNPTVMPFAGSFGVDPTANFTYCIQNMQTGYMSFLLQPINYALTIINNLGGEFGTAIQWIRNLVNSIRNFISSIIQNIFGVFLNILIQFQKIAISLRDMVGKTIGILTTLLYQIDGTQKTMAGAWASPPGDVMRALCFHPNTEVKLQDGEIKKMKELDLGDILSNGSMVCVTMKIKNFMGNKNDFKNNEFRQIEDLYKMKSKDSENFIYVTGSHLVQYKGNWIPVKNHPDAIISNKKTKWLSCLITNDHLIPINNYIFHDWEDDNGSPSKDLSDENRINYR